VIGWVGYARLVRAQALRAREFEFVQAARACGASSARIVLRHILPTAIPAVVVQATLGMAGAIIAEAALSFLGLVCNRRRRAGDDARCGQGASVRRPAPDHLSGACHRHPRARVQFLGDGLRDHVDPKTIR